ncbi:MAG: extracellular solute-binding protein, partial [Clostridia bacterium]|nr:extracellular solute-binding protein [Clostridia bacterium]
FSMPFEETMKWTLFMTEHAYQPIKTDTIKFDAVYELTNVELDVDVGESGSAQTKLMAAAASGKMYDITFLGNTQFRTYKTSLFYDLTDRIKTDLPNYYAAIKDEWNDLMTFATGGRLYGFAQTEYKYLYDEQGVLMPYIRVDIFENNNLKKPTTWKEWFESMKILKKKYPDSQPYASRSLDYILRYWTKQLGQAYQIYYNVEDAKWECGVLNASKFKNILQFMKDCYDEGILDQNFDQSSEKNFQDLATASKTFCTIDSGSPTSKANQILQETDKNAAFYAIDPLASHLNGGKTTTWYWPQSSNYQSMYYISSQAAHLEELLFFMDWCYTDEGVNTNNYGKLGETYELDKDGMAYVPEKLWKQKWPEGGGVHVYDWMSTFGLNQLCFAPYMNNQDQRWENFEWYPEEDYTHPWICDSSEEYRKGYASAQLNVAPDVSTELTARYDTLQAYIRNQIVGFIKGTREMSEYDVFVNDLKSMGIQELLDACNA